MAKWYIARPYAPPSGPLGEGELRAGIRQGTIGLDALVWSKGMQGWLPVRRVAGLEADAAEVDAFAGREQLSREPPPTVILADGAPTSTAHPPPARGPGETAPDHPGVSNTGPKRAQKGSARLRGLLIMTGAAGTLGVSIVIALVIAWGPADQATLYSPCIKDSIVELTSLSAAREVPCLEGTLVAQPDGKGVQLVLRGVAGNGMAAKAPDLVRRVLPNLTQPTLSRSFPGRQMLLLDLTGHDDAADRVRLALKIYRDAEHLVRAYDLVGGHRLARWLLPQGRLEAENRLMADGPQIVLRFVPGQGAPPPQADEAPGLKEGSDVPWAAPWTPDPEPPHLTELRKAMLAQGWWYRDADAFLNASAADGVDRGAAIAALRVIGEWLQRSDQWEPRAKHVVWSQCCAPRMNGWTGSPSRELFDWIAGARDAEPLANPLEPRGADDTIASEGRLFNAAIGSALHAYCSVASAEAFIDAGEESPANRMIRRAPAGTRPLAERLLKSRKFLASLGDELVKSRSQLLVSGPPLL